MDLASFEASATAANQQLLIDVEEDMEGRRASPASNDLVLLRRGPFFAQARAQQRSAPASRGKLTRAFR